MLSTWKRDPTLGGFMVLPLRAALLPTTFDSLGLSNLSSSSITSVGTDSLRKNPQVLRNRLPVVRNRLPSCVIVFRRRKIVFRRRKTIFRRRKTITHDGRRLRTTGRRLRTGFFRRPDFFFERVSRLGNARFAVALLRDDNI